MKKENKGFTLIELLVVISIVSLLTSSVLVKLNDVKAEARDAVRLSDMRQIRTALEAYRNRHLHYPGLSEGIPISGNQIGVGSPIDTALAPYLPKVPKDPTHDGVMYFYSYDPRHCTDSNIGACDCVGMSAVFAFNKAESGASFQKDTCSGGDQNINVADYNVSLHEEGT